MDHTKLDTVDLDSPCRDLSDGGLGFVVALIARICRSLYSLFSGIDFSCVYLGSNPAVVWFGEPVGCLGTLLGVGSDVK